MFIATQSWLHELESNMETISVNAYESLNKDTWWRRVAAIKNSQSKKEVLTWLISTAMIKSMPSGQAHFEDMLNQITEIENEFAMAGLRLKKEQLEDMVNGVPGGAGLDMAAKWSQDVGEYAAYWPQKQVAAAILAGTTSTTYDGLAFFHTGHYTNGVDSSDGTFSNILNPTTVGGATRIDEAVTADAAVANLSRIRAHIATIAMPNGADPRRLRIHAILHPPALRGRAMQLTNATTIAQAAASGGGGADVSMIAKDWMLEQPIQADELSSAFGGSDTTYYLIAMEGASKDQLGALVYQNREPFSILYHGPEASAKLARERELQWLTQGRNKVGYGHPYLLFKVDAS
jgi:phage major head subunit gpT-like protein